MSTQLIKKLIQCHFNRCFILFSGQQSQFHCSAYSLIGKVPVLGPHELVEGKERPKTITITGPVDVDVSKLSGIPEEHIKGRLVRIYLRSKNAMQSGTSNANLWELEFETRERWENPLLGWCSSGDPASNVKLQFHDKESAIRFADKYGYEYYVEPEKKEKPKVKSYGFNFSWNKRTRVSTK